MKSEKFSNSNTERKSGDKINLKTNLEDVPISPELSKFKRTNVSELINQPENIK